MELKELPLEYNKILVKLKEPRNRAERRNAVHEGIRIASKLATLTTNYYKHMQDPAAFEIYESMFKTYSAAWKELCKAVTKHERPQYYLPKSDYFYETFKSQTV